MVRTALHYAGNPHGLSCWEAHYWGPLFFAADGGPGTRTRFDPKLQFLSYS